MAARKAEGRGNKTLLCMVGLAKRQILESNLDPAAQNATLGIQLESSLIARDA